MDNVGVFGREIENSASAIRSALALPAGMESELLSKVQPVVDTILSEVKSLMESCPTERGIAAAERALLLARQVLAEAPQAVQARCAQIEREREWELRGLRDRRADTDRRLAYINAHLTEKTVISSEMCTWWASYHYVQMRSPGTWVYGTWGHGEKGDGGNWHRDLVLLPKEQVSCAA